jgi:hypothetical protein
MVTAVRNSLNAIENYTLLSGAKIKNMLNNSLRNQTSTTGFSGCC